MQFPAWMYHFDDGARLFHSQEELDAAGSGWADSPEAAEKIKPDALKVGNPYTTKARKR